MKKRVLGKTNIKVSEIALGGVYISSIGAEYKEAKDAVNEALKLGINYIDTAPDYENSEEVLGKVFRDIGKQPLILSTKIGGRPENFNGKNKDHLFKSVKESLKNLGRDYVDILFLHEADRPRQWNYWDDKFWYEREAKVQGPVLEVLDSLKKEGLIKYTGLGGTTAYEMANLIKQGNFDVVLTAFNYSLLWREAEIDLLPAATEKNMGIVVGAALQHGALSKRYDKEIKNGAKWLNSPRRNQYLKLYEFLDELNMPIVEACLRFVLSNEIISTVLVGAKNAKEVREIVEISEKEPLPDDVLNRLDKIAKMVPFRPYEEPWTMPFEKKYEQKDKYKGPGWIT
jgi:aryl-alcohol dehydrogenase-like predicted oxidoreductase